MTLDDKEEDEISNLLTSDNQTTATIHHILNSSLNSKKSNQNNAPSERVIYIWSVPANGHLNPTLCFTNQLLTRLDEINISKIVFYSGPAFRDLILNLPNNKDRNRIEFRDYGLKEYSGSENLLKLLMDWDTRPGTLFRVFRCYENSVKIGSRHIFNTLISDIHRDKPVLVLYDQALFFPKLTLSLYEKKYKCPKPLHGCYVTTFLCAKGIYPYWSELNEMGLLGKNNYLPEKARTLVYTMYDLCKYILTYYKTLWWDFGLSFYDLCNKIEYPVSKKHLIDESFNLVFVLPEIQPRLKQFESENIKWVGPCVDESVRHNISSQKINMQKYVNVIDAFLAKNLSSNAATLTNNNKIPSFVSQTSMSDETLKKLYKPIIYVSMGTVFNNENSDLFQVLVEACKFFAHKYAVIVSTGDEKAYEKYANSTLNSDSILLVPHTPQVEILKIAHLFITHAGMNSVSEAINYGVPIICLPLSGDQPFVAWRVADELGMGIRLQPDSTLTVDKVKESINQILTNPSYKQQATHLSKISQTYTGHVTACDLTINFIQENDELDLDLTSINTSNINNNNKKSSTHNDVDSNFDAVSKAKLIASRRLRTKAKKASRSFKSLFKYDRE